MVFYTRVNISNNFGHLTIWQKDDEASVFDRKHYKYNKGTAILNISPSNCLKHSRGPASTHRWHRERESTYIGAYSAGITLIFG